VKVSLLVNELNIRGGTHKQFLRLSQFLKDKNVEFEIITKYYNQNLTYPEFSNFKINYLYQDKTIKNNTIFNKIKIIYKLFNLISKDSKIVNIHDNGLLLLIPFLKIARKIIIWQVNDLPPYFLEGNSKNNQDNFKSKLKRFYTKFIIKNFVDEITVNASKNKERVLSNLDFESKVFYCGVDSLEDFKIHKFKKTPRINLLTTGVFLPYRNYETSIDIVKKINLKGLECSLDIIGETSWDQEYSKKIKSLVSENGLQDFITIHGQVDEDKFKSLFDDTDIFLFLNIDQSWGLVVFEAMSVGFPTIVSESVGAVEILNNEVAIITNPEDVSGICEKIINISKNKDVYNTYSRNAIKHVSNMSWNKMYSNKMLCLFKKYNDQVN
jgi:glycosyltransferase involved in cell wall biosynthesis